MIEDYHNTPNFVLLDIVSCEEILRLALDNLRHKKGKYYSFIKEHILNYEKLDMKTRIKVKKMIIFIQKCVSIQGEKKTVKNLDICLDKLGAAKNKSLYIKLCSICIKYSESKIINAFLKTNCLH